MKIAKSVNRLGTEAVYNIFAKTKKLAKQGKKIIDLSLGQSNFKSPQHAVDATIQALKDGHHGYTPTPGIPELREAVAADIVKNRGIEIDPKQVLVMPGGKVTMFFAILMFGEAGAEILYPNPGFPIYESVIEFSGAQAIPIPLLEDRDFTFNADSVLSQITPRTRLVILNSPANPTGGAVAKEEVDKLVAGLAEYPEVAVLSDEIYSRMCYDGHVHVSLLHYPEIRDRLILLDGWSKTYAMPGWRLGYSVWPETLVDQATRLAVNCHSCVNASAQYAGLAALEGPQIDVTQMVAAFDERRKVIVERLNALPGFRCRTPGGAFYAFPNIEDTGFDAKTLQNRLLEEVGVATVAGTSFGALGEGFIRFSYASSTERIIEAVERIDGFLNQSM